MTPGRTCASEDDNIVNSGYQRISSLLSHSPVIQIRDRYDWAAPAMTLIDREQRICGNCGRSGERLVLVSLYSFGSPDLDLRPPDDERSTMEIWLDVCDGCGYCAPDLTQVPSNRQILEVAAYRDALTREDLPKLARRFFAHAIAKSASDPLEAALNYLRAAWVCDDARLTSQSDECRMLAAEYFRHSKPFSDDEAGRNLQAVFVDVLRRSGQFEEACAESQQVIANPAVAGTVIHVLQYERTLIAQADKRAHQVDEALPPRFRDLDRKKFWTFFLSFVVLVLITMYYVDQWLRS